MELTDEDADRMDEYFGPRTYEKWSPINADATSELARAKRADKALWSYDHTFAVLSPYGTDYVEKAQLDFFDDPDDARAIRSAVPGGGWTFAEGHRRHAGQSWNIPTVALNGAMQAEGAADRRVAETP